MSQLNRILTNSTYNSFHLGRGGEEDPDYGILPEASPKRRCLGCGSLLRRTNTGNYCGPCDSPLADAAARCQACGGPRGVKESILCNDGMCAKCRAYYLQRDAALPRGATVLKPAPFAASTAQEKRAHARGRAAAANLYPAILAGAGMPGWVPALTWKDMVP